MKQHSIGKMIAELRKGKGWTQVELAEKLNVSDKTISKWESEAGLPEISQLPYLAKIFGISIDYLMTGKENNLLDMEKIVKNDDVKKIGKFVNKNYLDEKGHCILYYVYKYIAVKIFKSYNVNELKCDNYSLNDLGIDNYIYMSVICDKIDKDFFLNLGINLNLKIDSFAQIGYKYYSDKLCDYIIKNINAPIVEKLILSMYKEDNVNAKGEWQEIYRKLVHCAVATNNRKTALKLLHLFKEINGTSIRLLNNSINKEFDRKYQKEEAIRNSKLCCNIHPNTMGLNYSTIYNYAVINVELDTIRSALLKGWYDFVDLANQINKTIDAPILDEYEIKMFKLKNDKGVNEKDIIKESVIHNGIVCIRELIDLDDYDLYKELIQLPVNEDEKTEVTYSSKKLNFGACVLEGYQHWTFDKNRIMFDWIKEKNKDIRFFEHALKYDSKNLDKTLTYFVTTRPDDYEIIDLLLNNGAIILKEFVDSERGTIIQQDIVSTQILKNQIRPLKK